MITFAQVSMDAVPPTFFKWFFVMVIGLVVVAGIIVGIYATFRKQQPVKIDDQPAPEVRKAAKRYNHDLGESRYSDHERRLQELETWRNGLIEKLDADKEEILAAGNDRELRIQKDIADLPGKIVVDILNAQKLGRKND